MAKKKTVVPIVLEEVEAEPEEAPIEGLEDEDIEENMSDTEDFEPDDFEKRNDFNSFVSKYSAFVERSPEMWRMSIHRRFPQKDKDGNKISGYIRDLDPHTNEMDIAREFGSGMYRVLVHGPGKTPRTRNQPTIRANLNNIQISRDAELLAKSTLGGLDLEADAEPKSDPSSHMLSLMERMNIQKEKELRELRQAAMSPKESSIEKIFPALLESMRPPERDNSDLVERLRDDLNGVRLQHRDEIDSIRRGHQDEIERVRRNYEDTRTSMMDSYDKQIVSLRESYDNRLRMVEDQLAHYRNRGDEYMNQTNVLRDEVNKANLGRIEAKIEAKHSANDITSIENSLSTAQRLASLLGTSIGGDKKESIISTVTDVAKGVMNTEAAKTAAAGITNWITQPSAPAVNPQAAQLSSQAWEAWKQNPQTEPPKQIEQVEQVPEEKKVAEAIKEEVEKKEEPTVEVDLPTTEQIAAALIAMIEEASFNETPIDEFVVDAVPKLGLDLKLLKEAMGTMPTKEIIKFFDIEPADISFSGMDYFERVIEHVRSN